MLEALGLTPRTESVYLALIKFPKADIRELATKLRLSEGETRESLDELARMSLLQEASAESGELCPVDPAISLHVLLAQREAEFARRRQELQESKAAVAALLAEQAAWRSEQPEAGVEFLEGAHTISARLRDLVDSSHREICYLTPSGPQSPSVMEVTPKLDAEMINRGIRLRTVFLNSIRNDPTTMGYAYWLSELGGEVRTTTTLPLRLVIIDRARVMIPVDPEHEGDMAMLISSEGVVTALFALFHGIWRSATVLGHPLRPDGDGLSPQRRQALQLLAAGHTDETVARRLGVSARTARRVASELFIRLNARSRFQAGARAVEWGWITADDLDAS